MKVEGYVDSTAQKKQSVKIVSGKKAIGKFLKRKIKINLVRGNKYPVNLQQTVDMHLWQLFTAS